MPSFFAIVIHAAAARAAAAPDPAIAAVSDQVQASKAE
jgi:hypothetical protein